jgi:hypothetical protein
MHIPSAMETCSQGRESGVRNKFGTRYNAAQNGNVVFGLYTSNSLEASQIFYKYGTYCGNLFDNRGKMHPAHISNNVR